MEQYKTKKIEWEKVNVETIYTDKYVGCIAAVPRCRGGLSGNNQSDLCQWDVLRENK